MGVQLTVACADRTDEDLHALVLELANDLNQVKGLDAAPAESTAPAGSRGGMVSLGEIALAFISSGAAIAAINVIKTYIQREPSLKVRFQGADGAVVEIDAKRLSDANTALALGLFGKSVGKKPAGKGR